MRKILLLTLLSSFYLMSYSQNTATASPVCDGTEGEIAFVIDSDIFNDLSKPFTVKYAPTGTYAFEYRFFDTDQISGSFTDVPLGIYDVYLPTSDNCLELITVELISYSNIVISGIIEHPSTTMGCQNGSIDLTINGGKPPWDISWYKYDQANGSQTLIQENFNVFGTNDGEDISSLMPGRYYVGFTDDACGYNGKYFTLGESFLSEQAISSHVTNAQLDLCDNGSINITMIEGVEPFEFKWTYDDGNGPAFYSNAEDISQLINYEYCVTVTDALCGSISECYSIECCSVLQIDMEVNNATGYSCDDGSIDISVLNGIEPYTYYWTIDEGNGHNYYSSLEDIDQLRHNEYCVTVSDSECAIGNLCAQLSCCLNPPTFNVVNSDCGDNGSITINWHNGNPNYDVNWTGPDGGIAGDNIYNLTPGIYTAHLENQDCSYIREFIVGGSSLSYSVINKKNPTCVGYADDGEIEIEVITMLPYQVLWYKSVNGMPIGNPIGMGEHIMGLGPNEYLVVIEINNTCSKKLTFRLFCCYTNNSQGEIINNYDFPEITNSVITWSTTDNSCDGSNLNNYSSGLYFIKVFDNTNKAYNEKLIKI